MTRFTSTSLQAASEQPIVRRHYFVSLGVTSSTLYVSNADRFYFTLGNTYTPVGGFGNVSAIQEEADVEPRDVTLTLAAVNSSNLYEPLREDMFNREVVIREAFCDVMNGTLIADPEVRWKGRVAEVKIFMGQDVEAPYYEVRASTIIRRNARVQYFNKETFQLIDSSDTFGTLIDQIPLYKSTWGQEASNVFITPQYYPRGPISPDPYNDFIRGGG